jgi:hypothetical protein
MVIKDEARVRIGFVKVAAGFLILAVFGPLIWLATGLEIEYLSEPLYFVEFAVLLITTIVLIEASSRIIDKVYSERKILSAA